jgi:O-antigen/teichoic acid export membrane protein
VPHRLGGAGWVLIDQGLYSASNLAITILVARVADVRSFGAFALVYATVVVVLGTSDGLICEPFAVLHSASPTEEAHRALRRAAGAAVAMGAATGIGFALVAILVPGSARPILLAYAVVLPALLLQSLWRFGSFTLARPRTAVANDVVWVAVQVVALVAVIATDHDTPANLVLAWGAGAVAAALVGVGQLATIPDLRRAHAWLRDTASFGLRYAAEFLGTFGSSQAALSVTAAIAGLPAVAQLRGAQVVYGPITTLANGVRVAGTPVAVRQLERGREHLRRVAGLIGGGLTLSVVVWTGLVLALPESWGEAIAGDTWALAREVVPAVAVNNAAVGLAAGLVVSLRALADPRRSLRGRLATGLLRLGGATVGAVVADGEGAAWGLAVGAVLGLGVLYVEYQAAQRDQPARR